MQRSGGCAAEGSEVVPAHTSLPVEKHPPRICTHRKSTRIAQRPAPPQTHAPQPPPNSAHRVVAPVVGPHEGLDALQVPHPRLVPSENLGPRAALVGQPVGGLQRVEVERERLDGPGSNQALQLASREGRGGWEQGVRWCEGIQAWGARSCSTQQVPQYTASASRQHSSPFPPQAGSPC